MDGEQPAPAPRLLAVHNRAHLRGLYAFVYSTVGNREAAEDITRAAVVQARRPPCYPTNDVRSAESRHFHAARTAIAAYWPTPQHASTHPIEHGSATHTPDAAIGVGHQEQAHAQATALLNRLPETYRTVLSYRVVEGIGVAETARRMGIGEAAVKDLQHRALVYAAGLQKGDTDDRRNNRAE